MTLTLLPLSAAEIHFVGPNRLLDWAASNANFAKLPVIPKVSRLAILDLVVRGGYPELRELNEQRTRTKGYRSYVDSIVDRDVADLLAVRKTDTLRRLIDQLAARSGAELNYDALSGAIGINRKTLDTWLDALERLSIIRRLGSWASGETHREIRHPKLHIVDTGLLCALRNLSADSFGFHADPASFGAVLETFVFGEISKSLPHQENIWDLYHWRDRSGREIDIIAICPPTKLIGVEIKASASVSNEDFKHLKWFATDGPGRNREMTGIVIYLGGEAVSFGPRMVALPLQSLWANWIL
jgi:predicted AAA+ superfamily ATPase